MSRKKCSEQLRSWKIYWWAQKFLRGHKILKKGYHNFGFWDRADVILLAPKFWWFGAPKGSESSNFVFKNKFSPRIRSKLTTPHYFRFLHFLPFLHIFCIFYNFGIKMISRKELKWNIKELKWNYTHTWNTTVLERWPRHPAAHAGPMESTQKVF